MMVPSKTLLAGLALAAMGVVGNAQQQTGNQLVKVNQIKTATLKMSTGELIPGQNGGEKSVALANAFTNTDSSGFYGTGAVTASVSGNLIEWLDWGTQTGNTGSDIVGGFSFGYGTYVVDTALGGPGVTATLRFYDNIAGFCADSGAVPTASFSFTGLPGSSGAVGAGWLIGVDLSGGFEFCSTGAGNAFGFGFTTPDDDGTGSRNTGPILCYAGDGLGGPDANGQVDAFDEWDGDPSTNNCLGTFFFGGVPFDFSSWYLTYDTVDAANSGTASSAFRNGGSNPANYSVSAPPRLGQNFSGSATVSVSGLGVFIVGYATPLSFPTSFGQLLVNVADPGGELLAGFNGPYLYVAGTATITIPVPKNINLCGLALATQVVQFGGGVKLFNAQDLVVGVN